MTRARFGQLVHKTLGAGVATLVFTTAFAGSFLAHGDLPATRRFACAVGSWVLKKPFAGRIVVEKLDHLGFDGIDVGSAAVFDETGVRVIEAHGIHGRFSMVGVVRGALSALTTGVSLLFDDVRVDDAEVVLDAAEEGGPRLARTFQRKPSAVVTPPGPPTAPKPLYVALPHITVTHAWVHGSPTPAVPIDSYADGLVASVVVTEQGVSVDGERTAIHSTFLAPLDPAGTAEYHLRVSQGLVTMWTDFAGKVGAIPVTAAARMTNGVLEGAVDAASVSPEQVHSLVPSVPLAENVSAHLSIDGPVDGPHVTGRLKAGQGDATLDLKVTTGQHVTLSGSLEVRDLDPRALVPTAPEMRVGGDVSAHAVLAPAGLELDVDASTFPFVLAGQSVPGTIVHGRYENGALRGSLDVLEPGAPLAATFALDSSLSLSLDGEIRAQDLRAIPRLRGALEGNAKLKVSGKLAPSGLDAHIDGDLRGLGKGDSKLGQGALHARVFGKLTAPQLDADVDGRSLTIAGFAIDGAHAKATGPLLTPHVVVKLTDDRWSELSLAANLRAGRGLEVSSLSGTFTKADVDTHFRVKQVSASAAGVELRDIDVDSGAGTVKGDLALTESGLTADVHGKVDLEKLARAVPRIAASHGTGSFALHVAGNGAHHSGTLRAEIADAELYALPLRATATADAKLDDGTLAVTMSGKLQSASGVELATFRSSANGALAGPMLAKRSWTDASGTLSLDEFSVDLERVSGDPLVATARLAKPEIPELKGKVSLSGEVKRLAVGRLPEGSVEVSTSGLEIDTRGARKELVRSWKGIDALASIRVAQMTAGDAKAAPELEVESSLQLVDPVGPIAQASLSTRGELPVLLFLLQKRPEEEAEARARFERMAPLPISARLTWSGRGIDQWPEVIRPSGVKGTLTAAVDVSGTLGAPVGSLTVHADKLQAVMPGATPYPIDGSIAGRFTKGHAELVGSVVHENKEVAQLGWSVTISPLDAAQGRPHGDAWSMDALAQLHDFPLQAVPQIAARGVEGTLNGELRATGLHQTPRIDVNLSLAKARVMDATLDAGTLEGWLTDRAGVLALTMRQAAQPGAAAGGTLRVTVFPSAVFENGLRPELDPTRPQTIALQLSHFDVEPFSSFAAPVLADLRGYVDGEATMSLANPAHPGAREQANLWGHMTWTEGVVLVPQLGQSFTRGTMQLSLVTKDDHTSLELTGLSLQASTGKITGNASFAFPSDAPALLLYADRAGEGATPELSGTAHVAIDDQHKIPVTFEGVQLGEATGKADARLLVDAKGAQIAVAIPDLEFDVPDTERGVQGLSANPDVGVMDKQYRAGKTKRAKEATPVHLAVGIGSELSPSIGQEMQLGKGIVVRRAGMDVRLRGVPHIDLTDTMHVSGAIETMSGRVLALGKPFEVQQGTVTFDNDDPANPNLALSARWDAPDGTRVFADLDGHLKEAKLHMRSDPPRAEADVLSLVLFGRDPSQAGTQPGQTDTANLAAGTGVASTVLNSLLDPVQVFGRRIETRVDNSVTRGTSIGVATEIRPNLWAQVDVSTARQQERQNTDVSEVTLDWRFIRNWSLRTTVGDRGSTAFDLVWQYRY